jgi:CBS domain-containing protein
MKATLQHEPAMRLDARFASDLMTANPVSIHEGLTLHEAIAFLVDRSISGAPVIDDAGRPVGVLTQTDILIHDRETPLHLVPEADNGSPLPARAWEGMQLEAVDTTSVRDVMTPAVFCVHGDTPASKVVEQMRTLNVHRLFVTDAAGVLVGVITAMDVLRQLVPVR